MKELTTEELIKLAENSTKKQRKKKPKDHTVSNFINALEIKSGEIRVPSYLIYYMYKRDWGVRSGSKTISKTHFFRIFSQSFSQVRTGYQRYYMLNDSFNVSDETKEKAKLYEAKYNNRTIKRVRTKNEKEQ